MADALDSKSSEGNLMRVQVPPPVLVDIKGLASIGRESFFIVRGFVFLLLDLNRHGRPASSPQVQEWQSVNSPRRSRGSDPAICPYLPEWVPLSGSL